MSFLKTVLTVLTVLILCSAGVALAGTVTVFSGSAAADLSNPAPAGSTGLGPLGAFGGVGGPFTFTAPIAGTLTLTVDDCCAVGDVYQVFIDGISLGFTSAVPLNGPTNSSGVFTVFLTAGDHTWDINDTLLSWIGFDDPYGGGIVPSSFSPAGLSVAGDLTGEMGTVPEPASFLLSGSALLGLVALLRKRRP